MELTKGQNLLEHADEISSRPARTWFQTESDKKKAKGEQIQPILMCLSHYKVLFAVAADPKNVSSSRNTGQGEVGFAAL